MGIHEADPMATGASVRRDLLRTATGSPECFNYWCANLVIRRRVSGFPGGANRTWLYLGLVGKGDRMLSLTAFTP
jgi:hypothetical protein